MLSASKILSLANSGDLKSIIELCKQEIIEQSAKEKGGNTLLKRTKAAQKFLSKFKEKEFELRKFGSCIHKDPYDGEEYQCFTNGHVAFMLNEPLEGLPKCEGKIFNIVDIVHQHENQMRNKTEFKIDLPDIKAHITESKVIFKGAKNFVITYDIGNHRYNAELLLDCFNILGGDIKFYQDETKEFVGAILESENGIALILPMRKT